MIGGSGRLGSPGTQGPAGAAGAAGSTGATGPRGAGLASHVQYGLNALTITYGSVGSWTVGYTISVLTGGCVATGFEVNWTYSGSGTDSVTFLIWDNAGTLVGSATGSFTTTGYQVVSLASPLTMAAGTYTLGSSKSVSGYCRGSVSPKFSRNFGGNWTITGDGALLISSLNTRPTSSTGSGGEVYAVFFGLVTQ